MCNINLECPQKHKPKNIFKKIKSWFHWSFNVKPSLVKDMIKMKDHNIYMKFVERGLCLWIMKSERFGDYSAEYTFIKTDGKYLTNPEIMECVNKIHNHV